MQKIIPIENIPLRVAGDEPIGIPIKSEPQRRPCSQHRLPHRLRVSGAAADIDVYAIWGHAKWQNLGPKQAEKAWCYGVSRAMGRIDYYLYSPKV